jgi:hypothetical protein
LVNIDPKLKPYLERAVELLQGAVDESEDLKQIPDNLLCMAALTYAAGLARLTKLEAEGFVSLAIKAFQGVEVAKKKPLITM